MADSFTPNGNWFVYLYRETNMLTNLLQAFADYRAVHGEYWPAKIIIHRRNRLSVVVEGTSIQRGADADRWIIVNALYLSIDSKQHDPANTRRATVLQVKRREPVVDEYQTVYRRR